MGLIKEFKEFAMRGNVVDMAVGIVIGAAFGKIVNSLVSNVIMPPIGVITKGVDYSDWKIPLQNAYTDPATNEVIPAVYLQSGLFINTIVNFLIVAAAMFVVVKAMNKLKHLEDDEKVTAPPPPPRQEVLLEEIRDLLKNKT